MHCTSHTVCSTSVSLQIQLADMLQTGAPHQALIGLTETVNGLLNIYEAAMCLQLCADAMTGLHGTDNDTVC